MDAQALARMAPERRYPILVAKVPDYRVRHAVWDEVGRDRPVEMAERADQIEANTVGGHLELVTAQYRKARKFAPAVLGAFDFRASTETDSLLAAVDVLADLYDTGARNLPADAPTGFVPERWAKHVWGPDGRTDRDG
jgi:hypothetical protein